MARDGNGNYTLPEAAFVYDTVIDEVAVNSNFSDIASALTGSLAKNGETDPTANLPMATFHHTGVGNASARDDYAAAGQVQDSAFTWCGTAGGTADALTLTPSPAIAAYATGQQFVFKAGASPSTGAVTVAVSGLMAKDVEVNDAALSSSVVIEAGKYYSVLYDGTQFQLTRLSLLPLAAGSGIAVSGSTVTADPNNATDTAIATGDEVLFADADDSSAVKKDTVQGILDLQTYPVLDTRSPSSASGVNFTSGIDSTYSVYEMEVSLYATGAADLYYRASTNAGSSYLSGASDYAWSLDVGDSTSGASFTSSTNDTKIIIATLNANSGRPVEGYIRVYNPSSNQNTNIIWNLSAWNGSSLVHFSGSGTYKGAGTAINAFQLIPSASAFTGTVKLRGIR